MQLSADAPGSISSTKNKQNHQLCTYWEQSTVGNLKVYKTSSSKKIPYSGEKHTENVYQKQNHGKRW